MRSHPFLRLLQEEEGASWWVVVLMVLGLAVAVVVVVALLVPSVCCRIDPPCALPAASTPAGSQTFVSQPVGEPPAEGWVEIVPSEVAVESGPGGVEFTLLAVLRDKDGFVVPPVFTTPLTWTVGAPLKEVAKGDRSIRLKVPGGTQQAQTPNVSVATGSPTVAPSAPASVIMMPPSMVDHVSADHTGGATPTAVLADVKLKDNTQLADKPTAFVREWELGDVEQGGTKWGSVVILSPSGSPVVVQPPAGTGTVADDLGALQTGTTASAASLLDVDVAIWVALPASDIAGGVQPTVVAAQAKADLLWANDAYARARAGLQFVIWNSAPSVLGLGAASNAAIVDEVNAACKNQQWADLPVREPEMLNVYYVGSTGPEGISGSVNGEPVACLGWVSIRSLSVLAHELGHVLGLQDEYDWPETPFGAANVMGYLRSTHTAPRDHLALGQVFRVALSDYSWLIAGKLVDWTGVTCTLTVCPVTRLDLPRTPKP